MDDDFDTSDRCQAETFEQFQSNRDNQARFDIEVKTSENSWNCSPFFSLLV